MNLIFIYGPPAAGKLTVAKVLGKKLNYRVFNNHNLVSCIADVFPFDDERLDPILKRISLKYRLDIYRHAARYNVNLVTTYGGGSTKRFKFFKDVKRAVEKEGGKILFIQLNPSTEALYKRVISPSRRKVKIDNISYLKKQLKDNSKYMEKLPHINHIVIDNTDKSPKEVAEEIISYYSI